MSERLHLMGQGVDDVAVISALMQDAAVRVADVAFDPRARRFVLLCNRFRWEEKTPSRVRSALRIESVTAVKRKAWPTDRAAVLDLLALTVGEDGALLISFAGGASLRLETECLDLLLEDLTGPWGAKRRPSHAL